MWHILTICPDGALSSRLTENSGSDCEILSASSVDEAISTATTTRPDATVLFADRSSASWLPVVRALRQALPDQAIVAVASLSTDSVTLEALRAGADDVVDVETDPSELIHRVVTLCSLREGPGGIVRRAEARLRAAEARYRVLVERALFGVCMLQGGRIVYINPAGARMAGYEPAEIVGREFSELLPDEGVGEAAADAYARLTTGEVFEESRHITLTAANGEPLPLTYSAVATEFEGEPSLLVTFADAKEQLARQEAIEHRGRELELLRALAVDLSSSLDLDKVVTIGCDRIAALAGLNLCAIYMLDQDSSGLRLAGEPYQGEGMPKMSETLANMGELPREPCVVNSQADCSCQALHEKAGLGAYVMVPLRAHDSLIGVLRGGRAPGSPLSENDLQLLVSAGTSVGLALENARLYANLRESYKRIVETQAELVRAERLAALGELSATVAHEVRNPLAAIYNALSQLRRLVPAGGDATTLLNIAQEEATRLNRMIGDLLQFARPGEADIRVMPLDDIVESALRAAHQDSAAREEIQIVVDPIPPDLVALCDAGRLRQALVNLVVNSYQAIQGPGTIRLSAEESKVEHSVDIIVEDDGPGMSEETLERAFDPFFTTKPAGSGLGLSIVRRLVEDQGGTVRVASELDKNTRFIIRLNR